jgi:DNA polymerase-3 subunit alpha
VSFCHCHLHAEFSLLDGCGKSSDYAERAVEIGQEAVAITDHGNLAGALYHAQACEEKGIKPIIGMEAYFKPDAVQALKDGDKERGHHLLLIAKNMEGFRNLMRLSSAGFAADRFYYNPIIDWPLLMKHHQGLICTSTCVQGYLPQLVANDGDWEGELDKFVNVFGEDFFMEIQPHDFDLQHKINDWAIECSFARGLPLLATIDAHYPDPDWRATQDTAVLLATGSSRKKRDEEIAEGKRQLTDAYATTWMMSADEVYDHFADIGLDQDVVDEAMKNTLEISNRCEPFSYDKSPKVPKATESPEEAERILRDWCDEGLERVGKKDSKVYTDRIEEELAMFKYHKVLDYFVIIGDLVREAKRRGIRVGAGRGSAGASLVLYLSGVTAMDPIGYDLLFARFMTEASEEMPDVDIDFQHNRRDEMKDYLFKKYGEDYVISIAAFQSFGMKSVIQAVARALDIDYAAAIRASRDLDDEAIGTTLEDVVDVPGHEKLAAFADDYPEAWEIALKLEGQIKGTSKHAAAVVLTDQPVTELMPTMRAKDESTVTQWTARANANLLDTYGFLKIDLLATVGLTIQQEAIELIEKRHDLVVNFEDPETHPEVEFPIGDEEVCRNFSSGRLLGIFQFGNSEGMLRCLRQIKPTEIDHLIAANAMYRPGPIQNIGAFADRKNGSEEWWVPEAAEPVLGHTFGIVVYQEQVMQLTLSLGGFSGADAHKFRKIVAKGVARDAKGRKKMQEYKEQFFAGAEGKGVDEEFLEALWLDILEMASYSFNRAHAAGYALQAYQDYWLKTYYPLEFYASLLKWDPDKAALAIREARASSIKILPPDANDSGPFFEVVGDNILFGLMGIKDVGQTAADAILLLRPFEDVEDFEAQVAEAKMKRQVNAKVRKALVEAGAFDFCGARDDLSEDEKADLELERIKFAPSRPSDLAVYREFLENECDLHDIDEIEDGEYVNLVGEITAVKKHTTAKGHRMAFVRLWYEGRDFEAVLWQDKLDDYESYLQAGNTVLIHGKWQEEKNSIICSIMDTVRGLAVELTKEVA